MTAPSRDARKTPLDGWISSMMGAPATRRGLSRFALHRLADQVDYARLASPFYNERLAQFPETFPSSLRDFASLPLTGQDQLARNPLRFLAVPQESVDRIVTLPTSGSTGTPKRLFFTEKDLNTTMEIFRVGMSSFVRPGGRVLVLLPWEKPGSIGDLLGKSLALDGIRCNCLWPLPDEKTILEEAAAFAPDCLAGLPAQILCLARHPSAHLARGVTSVLLCADFAAESLIRAVSDAWNCLVMRHYALTELGYGGALECPAQCGFHVMEGHFLFEVVDPHTGTPLPSGRPGEVVVTTLAAKGTPLLRYRTGDGGRILRGRCPCGSSLRRVEIMGRIGNGVTLSEEGFLPMARLDEALFALPWLGDYSVAVEDNGIVLALYVPGGANDPRRMVGEALEALEGIRFPTGSPVGRRVTIRFPEAREPSPSSVKRMAHPGGATGGNPRR